MNLHFSVSPSDKPNERFLPIDLLNDDLQLLNHSPETVVLYWGRTYIKWVELPEGHTSQLSPNISRWISQLIDSSGGELEFRCCGSKQRQSTFSLSNGQQKWQIQQLTCFYSLAVSVKNHFFFRSFNRNLWQAHTDDFHINSAFSSFIVSPTSLYRSGGTLVLFIRHLSPGHFPRTRPSLFCLRCFEALPSVPCKD